MICNCVCRCTNLPNPSGEPPTLCFNCQIMDELCSPAHGLPAPQLVTAQPVNYAPLSDEQRDRAFQRFTAEAGL